MSHSEERISPPDQPLGGGPGLDPQSMGALLRGLGLSKTGLGLIVLGDAAFVVFLGVLAIGYVMAAWSAAKRGQDVSSEWGAAYRIAKTLVALLPLVALRGQALVLQVWGLAGRGLLLASATFLGLSIPARLMQNHLALWNQDDTTYFLLGLFTPLGLHLLALLAFLVYLGRMATSLGRPDLAEHFQRLLFIGPTTVGVLLLGCVMLPPSVFVIAPLAGLVVSVMAYVSLGRAINRLSEAR